MDTTLDNASIPEALRNVLSPSARNLPVNLEIDARGLRCPLPLLKAKQGLRTLGDQDLLRVVTSDAGSLRDFVAFAQLSGQLIQHFDQEQGDYYFVVRKQV